MAFCRLSVDNLPHSPYNTNAYAMFVDVSVYEEVLMDIFEKCERRSRVDEAKELGIYPYFHALESRQDAVVQMEGKRRIMLGSNNYLGLTTDPEVVDLGVRFLRTISLFYLMPAATNGIQGFFRGMGDLKVTLNSSMLNMGGRVAAAALFVLVMKMDIEALPFSYAVGWLLMLLYELPLLVRFLHSSEM